MTQIQIPGDLVNIIFAYAYNVKGQNKQTNPLYDLTLQTNIQNSIPKCFLMSRLPKPEWFTTQKHPLCGPCWKNCAINRLCDKCYHNLECILVPSPYQRGNPYYPSYGLDKAFPKWSTAIGTYVDLLSRYSCRKNHVYKACILRKTEKMFTESLLLWNEYYGGLFSKDFMSEPKSFFLNAYPWANQFITTMCAELREAQFLPVCSDRRL